jgi:S1-C subfamily serine protease/regulation of enolase protein 1 (concanavalin A-like superfamily)
MSCPVRTFTLAATGWTLSQGGAVARIVICPSCQYQGSLPDEAQPKRIRCPKCKEVFDVSAATPSSAGSGNRPASGKRPAVGVQAAFDDSDSVQSLPTPSNPGSRRAPATISHVGAGSGQSRLVYAALGLAGLAVVLLSVVLVVVLTKGSREPAPKVNDSPSVAQTDSPSHVIERIAAVAPAETTVTPTASRETSNAAPIAPSVIDGPEIVRRLKDATVYIILKLGGKPFATGTGFVIETREGTVLIASNRHVCVPNLSAIPPKLAKAAANPSLEVVFRSGLGRQNEQALPAELIATDSLSDELNTDLAFLTVKGVTRPPVPVNVFARTEPTEGTSYIGAGYPLVGFINQVAETKGNQSVTITGGRIAALKRDEYGQISLLQVDGSLHPGNSGGPIVEEKTGNLLGVAVASLTRAGISNVGFIVPAEEVRRCLAGRVGAIEGTRLQGPQGTADLQLRAQIVDPKGLVRNVLVHVAPASAGVISPNSDGSWPPLPNTKGTELMRDPKTPFVAGRIQVALKGTGADANKVLIQTAHRDLRGRLVYSKPKEVVLPERGSFGRAGKLQFAMKALQRKSLALLGPLVDPDKDCQLTKDEDRLKIKIDIPGKLHTLSPEITTRKNRKVSLHNAPFTLTEIEGDFIAQVQVTGEISPGSATPKDRQGLTFPITDQSAGLIIYQDKNNFLRLERAASIIINSLTPVHHLIIEAVKDGKQAMKPIYLNVPEADTLLLLERRKGRVRCVFSPNGGKSYAVFRELAVDLPSKVKVGLTAGNISAKPFSATFDNFALLGDATMIDDELGDSGKAEAKKP